MSYNIVTVRLTADNIDSVFQPGDAFTDDPEFGTIGSAGTGFLGRDYAMIVNARQDDMTTIGLPQTVRLTRVTV